MKSEDQQTRLRGTGFSNRFDDGFDREEKSIGFGLVIVLDWNGTLDIWNWIVKVKRVYLLTRQVVIWITNVVFWDRIDKELNYKRINQKKMPNSWI